MTTFHVHIYMVTLWISEQCFGEVQKHICDVLVRVVKFGTTLSFGYNVCCNNTLAWSRSGCHKCILSYILFCINVCRDDWWSKKKPMIHQLVHTSANSSVFVWCFSTRCDRWLQGGFGGCNGVVELRSSGEATAGSSNAADISLVVRNAQKVVGQARRIGVDR